MSMKENRLFQILEPRILKEGSFEQLQQTGELVKRCLSLKSDERTTMKEVASELEGIRKLTQHPWIQQEDREENVALLGEQSGPVVDLYAINLGPEFITRAEDTVDSPMIYPIPRLLSVRW